MLANLKNPLPKATIDLQRGTYRVLTVTRTRELAMALSLRYQVFHREYRGATATFGFDIDEYDRPADHLVVLDTRPGCGNRVVGTYRLLCSLFNEKFYSESEFTLAPLLSLPGTKLELGRACIDPDHRNGLVLALLWRGVCDYAEQVGAKWLFGCSSIKTTSPREIASAHRALELRGALDDSIGIRPHPSFEVPSFATEVEALRQTTAFSAQEVALPALLESYLSAGAKVVGWPALDRDFKCADFLTVMEMTRITARYRRRFTSC